MIKFQVIIKLYEKLSFHVLTLKEIKSQLDKPDGNRLNYIAPANGLTLWKVKY